MNIIGKYDRNQVAILEPRDNSVLIVITSTHNEFPKLHDGWTDVLRLQFDDVENNNEDIGENRDTKAMTSFDAKRILEFVIKYIDCDFFVSCDAGISRSAGVVVALEQIFNGRDVSKEYAMMHYNKGVKNIIRDTWFKTIWKNGKNGCPKFKGSQ